MGRIVPRVGLKADIAVEVTQVVQLLAQAPFGPVPGADAIELPQLGCDEIIDRIRQYLRLWNHPAVDLWHVFEQVHCSSLPVGSRFLRRSLHTCTVLARAEDEAKFLLANLSA